MDKDLKQFDEFLARLEAVAREEEPLLPGEAEAIALRVEASISDAERSTWEPAAAVASLASIGVFYASGSVTTIGVIAVVITVSTLYGVVVRKMLDGDLEALASRASRT